MDSKEKKVLTNRSLRRNHPFQRVDQAAFPVLLESVQPPNLAMAL